MKATATLETVIDRVHQMSVNQYDEIVPVQDMEFDSLNQMWISGRRVEILPSAQRLLSNRLRVPYSYLSRCPESLQARNLNYWIEQERQQRDTFFCRFDGDQLRAVFTERYTALDHMEILSAMLGHGFRPDQEVQYSLDQGMMVVKVPNWDGVFDVAARDTLVPGISFANSEVGVLAFCVEVFFWRCICSNGMIVSVSAGHSRFKHVSRKAFENFPETVSQVMEDSSRRRELFAISTQTPVQNPVSTIESFNRRFGLTKDEGDAVMRSWLLEPAYTMWAVINAITAAAKDPGLTTEAAYRLEKVGGQVLSLVNH